jgi:hypothetical protein
MVSNAMYHDHSIRIANYCNFKEDMMSLAVPFEVPGNFCIEDKLPKPNKTEFRHQVRCKELRRQHQQMDAIELSGLVHRTTINYNTFAGCLAKGIHARHVFTDIAFLSGENKYFVKILAIPSYRYLLTYLKDIFMTEKIWKSSWNDIHGKDIVCKPIFCCPVWNGKKWFFVSVCEMARGKTLENMTTPFNRLFMKYDKHKAVDALQKVVYDLWCLGFCHNDLRDANVLYDAETNTAKTIDMETCVQLPCQYVEKFRQLHVLGNTPIVTLFTSIYKIPAVSLLFLSEKFCLRYAKEGGSLFNTDDYFVEEVCRVLG